MEQNKNASKSKHRPVGFNLGERKSSKQKSQGFVVRFHHDLKVLRRGYLSSLGGVGLPKFPIVYRKKFKWKTEMPGSVLLCCRHAVRKEGQ